MWPYVKVNMQTKLTLFTFLMHVPGLIIVNDPSLPVCLHNLSSEFSNLLVNCVLADVKSFQPLQTHATQIPFFTNQSTPINKINYCTTFNTFSIDYPVSLRKSDKHKIHVQPCNCTVVFKSLRDGNNLCFWKKSICLTTLHLFDQKYSNIVKYY